MGGNPETKGHTGMELAEGVVAFSKFASAIARKSATSAAVAVFVFVACVGGNLIGLRRPVIPIFMSALMWAVPVWLEASPSTSAHLALHPGNWHLASTPRIACHERA